MRAVYFLVATILAVAACGASAGRRGLSGIRPVLKRPRAGLSGIRPVLKRPRAGRHISFAGQYRILDNKVAMEGQFPYQVLVKADNCYINSGSLIAPTVVLTNAASVVGYHMWNVTLGSIHLDKADWGTWSTQSTWGWAHPNYNCITFHYDVAVIILPKRAPVGDHIQLVSLPSRNEINDDFVARTALVAGWGYPPNSSSLSDRLLFAEVTVVPNEICESIYAGNYVIESTLCAAHENHAITFGDGGAALVIQTDKGYKQIGVASFWARDQAHSATIPAGYTRVTSILGWIRKMAGNIVH